MYDLPFPASCLAVSPAGDAILVSGIREDSWTLELAIFALPAKILTQNSELEGLIKARDFGIQAGIRIAAEPLEKVIQVVFIIGSYDCLFIFLKKISNYLFLIMK